MIKKELIPMNLQFFAEDNAGYDDPGTLEGLLGNNEDNSDDNAGGDEQHEEDNPDEQSDDNDNDNQQGDSIKKCSDKFLKNVPINQFHNYNRCIKRGTI